MSLVHPFPARVVRPEWAHRLVTGLAELPEDTGTLPPVGPPDPAAYDDAEPAVYVYRQQRDGMHELVEHGGLPIFHPAGGRERGLEAVGPKGAQRHACQTEQSSRKKKKRRR